MDVRPTRCRRVGGKNFDEFLPTRRRRATTTHVPGGEGVKHIAKRIGGDDLDVKRRAASNRAPMKVFCIERAPILIV